MNVLLIGNGGRENALAWAIARSPRLTKLFIAPGNPGTASLGTNVMLSIGEHKAVVDYCKTNAIDLVVVGPEAPDRDAKPMRFKSHHSSQLTAA